MQGPDYEEVGITEDYIGGCLSYCFPGGASGKEPACQSRRHKICSLIPGSGRSPEGWHSHPFHSCLENPMDRGAWQATVLRVTKTGTGLM